MRNIFLGLILIATMTISAYAMYGVLKGQETDGMTTYCYYTNGEVITVGAGANCPVSID